MKGADMPDQPVYTQADLDGYFAVEEAFTAEREKLKEHVKRVFDLYYLHLGEYPIANDQWVGDIDFNLADQQLDVEIMQRGYKGDGDHGCDWYHVTLADLANPDLQEQLIAEARRRTDAQADERRAQQSETEQRERKALRHLLDKYPDEVGK